MRKNTTNTSQLNHDRPWSHSFPAIIVINDVETCSTTNTVTACDREIPSLWTSDGVTIGFHLLRDFFNDYLTKLYTSQERNSINQWKSFIRKDLLNHSELSQQTPRTKDDCWILMSWETKQDLWNDYLNTYETRYDLTQDYQVLGWCYQNLYDVMLRVFSRLGNNTKKQQSWVDTTPFAVLQHVSLPTEYTSRLKMTL